MILRISTENFRSRKGLNVEGNVPFLVQIFHKIVGIFHLKITDCQNAFWLIHLSKYLLSTTGLPSGQPQKSADVLAFSFREDDKEFVVLIENIGECM